MQHEDFKAGVTKAFKAKKEAGGIAKAEELAVRAKIAQELFQAEPQDVRLRIEAEADAEAAALKEKHQDAMEGLPGLDEEARSEWVESSYL
jgi:hypothetical protein